MHISWKTSTNERVPVIVIPGITHRILLQLIIRYGGASLQIERYGYIYIYCQIVL